MKRTLIALVAAFGLTATAAAANDFNDTGFTLTATTGAFEFQIEGTANTGYNSLRIGAEVLSYNLSDTVDASLDVFGAYYRAGVTGDASEEIGLGTEYTMGYTQDALRLYGSAEVEYLTRAEVFLVTPTVGAAYQFDTNFEGFAEVGYTWDASNDWAAKGGLAEVGVNIGLAENIVLTPSIRHTFDRAVADNTQVHLGVSFSF